MLKTNKLSPDLSRFTALLTEKFGFDRFRPGQEAVIAALEADNCALAVFPTGAGKSLCYQLPALTYDGITLVVSPLIALMKDQIDFLTRRGIAAARLDSSLTLQESQAINDRLQAGQLKLLYVAPERFNNERFLALIARIPIALFAIDEAHCISEWGHNFRPDYLKLAETVRNLGVQRVLALTATATPAVVDDICAAFQIPKRAAIVTGFYRRSLKIAVTPVEGTRRDERLVKRLKSRPGGSTIVYVTLQKTAERLADVLKEAGFAARPYHAGMETEQRTAVQEWWMAVGDGIVTATIAFGMGIDKANVRYVYHYNLPKSLESYSQEIGRAARDGEDAIVEMLACPDDVSILENFAYGDTPSKSALRGMIRELMTGPTEFDLSLYELSNRYDIRQLVLRTALTYLELLGVLKQGTPFYAGYEIRLLVPLEQVIAGFPGEPGQFVADIFKQAKFGRTWYSLNPDVVAQALRKERRRVVRCIEVIEERGLAEIRASDSRMRFTRIGSPDADELVEDLNRRFLRREQNEVSRIQQVLDLVTGSTCITNALAAHFGEIRGEPCGHCSYCKTGKAAVLPETTIVNEIPSSFPSAEWKELRRKHPDALAEPRQSARFLCGLSGPGIAKARLGRNPLFGALEEVRFQTVLDWCEANLV